MTPIIITYTAPLTFLIPHDMLVHLKVYILWTNDDFIVWETHMMQKPWLNCRHNPETNIPAC